MGVVQFYNGKALFTGNDKVAMGSGCCCGGIPIPGCDCSFIGNGITANLSMLNNVKTDSRSCSGDIHYTYSNFQSLNGTYSLNGGSCGTYIMPVSYTEYYYDCNNEYHEETDGQNIFFTLLIDCTGSPKIVGARVEVSNHPAKASTIGDSYIEVTGLSVAIPLYTYVAGDGYYYSGMCTIDFSGMS